MCRRVQVALSMGYFVYLHYQVYMCFSQNSLPNSSHKISNVKMDLNLKN